MTILDDIRAQKVQEVAARRERRPLPEVVAAATHSERPHQFAAGLRTGAVRTGLALIAEVKRRSPAAGELRLNANAADLGTSYVKAGASAVSVLTDEKFFSGSDEDLAALRNRTDAPLLRKDFTISDYQVYEARSLGADAILLILGLLDDEEVEELREIADGLGMDAVVEAHSEEEVARAVNLGVPIIGLNNRDLTTFTTDLATTERLRPLIPADTLVIAESGIVSRADVQRMLAVGAQAVLVGESLVRSADPSAKVRELLGLPE